MSAELAQREVKVKPRHRFTFYEDHFHEMSVSVLWEKINKINKKPIVCYIEDIYSFAMNTINIFIKCNENISIFTSAKHE